MDLVEAVKILNQGDALSRTYHGNISAKIPGSNLVAITRRSILNPEFSIDDVEIIEFDDSDSLAKLHPSTLAVIDMHRAIYDMRPDIRSVIHTHSPHATSFAIASKPIPLSYQLLLNNNFIESIPVATYGPRGSQESINNMRSVINEKTLAVLLEFHGLVVFSNTVIGTANLVVTVEESAELISKAYQLSEVKEIPV